MSVYCVILLTLCGRARALYAYMFVVCLSICLQLWSCLEGRQCLKAAQYHLLAQHIAHTLHLEGSKSEGSKIPVRHFSTLFSPDYLLLICLVDPSVLNVHVNSFTAGTTCRPCFQCCPITGTHWVQSKRPSWRHVAILWKKSTWGDR